MNTLTPFIYGGLGNQMFQYAFAKALSEKYGCKLNLNLYGFKIDKFYKRLFELDRFNLQYDGIEDGNALRFNISRLMQHYPNITLLKAFFRNLIVEKTNLYEKNTLAKINTQRNYHIYGYWQDERHFVQIRTQLLSIFSPKEPLSERNRELLTKIKGSSRSIAVHVRRMHFVETGTTPVEEQHSNNHTLGERYYQKAFKYMAENTSSPVFYIFSDHPEWAKTTFKDYPYKMVILDNDRGNDFEDIVLMNNCNHHIIANSSFSWWGAWLCTSTEQIVIAPKATAMSPKSPNRWLEF